VTIGQTNSSPDQYLIDLNPSAADKFDKFCNSGAHITTKVF
jgi:hypothetical protein